MEIDQELFAGLTSAAGAEGGGTAFTIQADGSNFTLLHTFRKLGYTPTGNLIQGREPLGSLALLRKEPGEGEAGDGE